MCVLSIYKHLFIFTCRSVCTYVNRNIYIHMLISTYICKQKHAHVHAKENMHRAEKNLKKNVKK